MNFAYNAIRLVRAFLVVYIKCVRFASFSRKYYTHYAKEYIYNK